MTYDQIIEQVKATMHFGCSTADSAQITNFVAGDLMSDILTLEDEYFVLITSLATEQTLRTADFVGARAVLLVNGKKPQPRMLELAKDLNISILSSPFRMFKVCLLLGKHLEAEGQTIR